MAIHPPQCRADLQFSALYNIFKRLPTIFRSKHTNRKHAHRPHLLIRQTKTKGSRGGGMVVVVVERRTTDILYTFYIYEIFALDSQSFFSLLLNTSYMNCVYGRNNSQILYRTISCSLLWKRFYFAGTICICIRKILFTSLLFSSLIQQQQHQITFQLLLEDLCATHRQVKLAGIFFSCPKMKMHKSSP